MDSGLFKSRSPLATLVLCGLLFARTTLAIDYTLAPDNVTKSRLGIVYLSFSGDAGKSLNSQTGFGLEFQREKLLSWATLYMKLRLENSSDTGMFLDGSTERNLAYDYLAGFTGVGFTWNPFLSSGSGLKIYLGGGLDIGFAQISLPNTVNYTNLKNSDSNLMLGYELIAGFANGFGNASGKSKWGFFMEATFRQISGELQGHSSFDLGGIQLSTGVYW